MLTHFRCDLLSWYSSEPKRSKAIVFDPRDNVATSLSNLREGTEVCVAIGKNIARFRVRQTVPIGHKIALRSLRKGGWVTKYGEVIGRATRTIRKGDHVHIHNIRSAKTKTGKPQGRQR